MLWNCCADITSICLQTFSSSQTKTLYLLNNNTPFYNPSLPVPGNQHSTSVSRNLTTFSSVAQLCPAPCDPVDCSMPGLPVHHQLLELAQTHIHWVSVAIQPSHPLWSPSPPAFNLPNIRVFSNKSVSSLRQVAKDLEFQFQHQSFYSIFRDDFL